jgi:hypothetical protein
MTTIVTKRSITASAAPDPGDLAQGELAVNLPDRKLYTKDETDTIVLLAGGDTVPGALPAGGADGDMLYKVGNTDFDAVWGANTGTPSGGTTGQVLTKDDNGDYSYSWQDSSGGGGSLPDSTSLYNTLRADNSGGWVENSWFRLRDSSASMGVTSPNWATFAVTDGRTIPSSGNSASYSEFAVAGNGDSGMAVISGDNSFASIALGTTSKVDNAIIRWDDSEDELEFLIKNDTAFNVTAVGSWFGNYSGNGARVVWEGNTDNQIKGDIYVDSADNFVLETPSAGGEALIGKAAGTSVWYALTNGDFQVLSLTAGAVYSTANGTLTNTPTLLAQQAIDERDAVIADLLARVVALETP